jgi:multiple sugar transport system permease protein
MEKRTMRRSRSGIPFNRGAKVKKHVIHALEYLLLIFMAFLAVIPIWSCVVTASKTPAEYNSTNVMTFPHNWFYSGNYQVAWTQANMGTAFINSFLVLVVVLAGSIFFNSMLAFVLNRFKFPGSGIVRNLFLFATLLPGIAMQVTVYKIMYELNLINTLPGYMILMMGSDVISIYIFLQFFENLPVSLDESAILDGCTYFGVYFKILLPLTKPAIITCLILKGVSTYNEYYMANLYLQDKTTLQVVSTALYTFQGPLGTQYNFVCAGVIITIIPALVIFILCQKQIYSGLAAGAVKA